LPPTPEAEAALDELVPGAEPDEPTSLIVVHPGAGIAARSWPASRFLEVVRGLAASRPARFAFIVGPDEVGRDEEAPLPELPRPARAFRLPLLTLDRFAALLRRTDLLIANESAPSHLAAAVGCPVVVPFLSGNDPSRWGPWGDSSVVVEGPVGSGPAVEDVLEAALNLLAQHPPTNSRS
jgi:ADP-heptose:LPS heptosyltransferase